MSAAEVCLLNKFKKCHLSFSFTLVKHLVTFYNKAVFVI